MRLDMEVNVLIGIKYKLIHPEAIHTLPSGMTLYKCKLVGHNHGQNAMIRGPHFTFDCLREQAGGVANMVVNFVRSIDKYRDEDCYAPRVPNDPAKEEPGNIGVNYQSCGVNYSCEDWIADCLVLTFRKFVIAIIATIPTHLQMLRDHILYYKPGSSYLQTLP